MVSTGSLWPYRLKKNLRLSRKKILMVLSSNAAASSLPVPDNSALSQLVKRFLD